MEAYKDNVIESDAEMRKALKGVPIVNPQHEVVVIHSEVMDCNPHTKVKFEHGEAVSKTIDKKLVIFVPSSATQTIDISAFREREIILDIRSCNIEGSVLFTIFRNFIGDFAIAAESPDGKRGKVYMSADEPYISDKPIASSKSPAKRQVAVHSFARKWTVLIDRYTFRSSDEYCAMIMAYFCKHYRVKGEHFHMYKYIYKTVRFPVEANSGLPSNKIAFALPVIRLIY